MTNDGEGSMKVTNRNFRTDASRDGATSKDWNAKHGLCELTHVTGSREYRDITKLPKSYTNTFSHYFFWKLLLELDNDWVVISIP